MTHWKSWNIGKILEYFRLILLKAIVSGDGNNDTPMLRRGVIVSLVMV